jgi:RecA-family ATPase
VIVTDNDTKGRAHGQLVAQSLSGIALSVRVLALPNLAREGGDVSDWIQAGGTEEELVRLTALCPQWSHQNVNNPDVGEPVVVELADAKPDFITWLWPPYLPESRVTIMAGPPGVGKSYIALAVTAALSVGGRCAGAPPMLVGRTLLCLAEHSLSTSVLPRLNTMGADISMISAITGTYDSEGEESDLILNETGLAALDKAIAHQQPRLVIIDPLVAFLSGRVDIYRANEARQVTRPLARIAEQYGCAIIAIIHLNKAQTIGRKIAFWGAGISPQRRGQSLWPIETRKTTARAL